MAAQEVTLAQPPTGVGLEGVREAATHCTACPLWEHATQTVFGAGPADARVMFVGEQPGDVEDRKGLPFVGPAGRLLDKALVEAGIDRDHTYVTNAVKHFRFTATPKRRLHQTPGPEHIAACKPWLAAEIELVDPELVVCLGATAAKALLGPSFRVTRSRGQLLPWPASAQHPGDFPVAEIQALATIHPSAVLRVPPEAREEAYAALVADLRVGAAALAG